MTLSLEKIQQQLSGETKAGEIKKLAKEIKQNHELAMQLWDSGLHNARLLATLLFDKKQLTREVLESFANELLNVDEQERNRITEWLLANQLTKSKPTTELLESWQRHESPVLRRLFWYHQARLRWTGKIPKDNADALLTAIETDISHEKSEVQWVMNFTAGWIGIFDEPYRERCIKLGEQIGLYKDEKVPKNCTPSYLPEFIRVQVEKQNN